MGEGRGRAGHVPPCLSEHTGQTPPRFPPPAAALPSVPCAGLGRCGVTGRVDGMATAEVVQCVVYRGTG